MKRLIIAVLLLSGVTLKAQHDISVDVLGFAFSKYGLGYDYAINSNNSVGINFNFSSKNMFDDGKSNFAPYALKDGEYKYSEMNIIPEYKAYFTPEKGTDGIYMGIYGKIRTSKASENTFTDTKLTATITNPNRYAQTDVSTTGFALGVMAGYKWKSSGALFLEVTGGIGKFLVNSVKYSNTLAEDDPNFEEDDYIPYIGNSLPIDLRIAVKVGVRIGGGSNE
ncbi:MAG: DUF3575 domain-containing protein [Flavobacteriales bacterium]|nr:DUF3575 domain-containing protein [Flavobacteriales bacterium]